MAQEALLNNTRPERGSRQIRHLAQYAIVEEGGTSAVSRAMVILVSLVLLAFILWASFLKIDEVAVTFGSAVPSRSVQVVQHLEGGIVRDILVEDRAMVSQGQVLLRLDPVQAQAELEQAVSRRAALSVRAERIRAFTEGREANFTKTATKFQGLASDQSDILRANTERWMSQHAVIDEQIQQKREEIKAVRQQQHAVREQLKLLGEEEVIREDAFKEGVSSKISVFAARRQRAAMESELSRMQGQEQTARKALDELEKRAIDLDANLRQDAFNDLGTVTAELSQVEEAILRLEDRVKRLEITAPVKGYVQNLKAKTVGAVIPAGGMVMEIVPVDGELQVETKISTRDVGHLREGQQVILKVATYDFVRYGTVKGLLKQISATTYIDEKDASPYYKGWIVLEKPYVGSQSGENPILPGMTVQADIITGDKTLLQYLLKPIHVSLAQAFRER
ncbi:hypothetical protein A6A04_13865 [Paramagnetospirillum marisnigri]|uniref:Membrane fusion protein (MFP) family protein n=1 Tax=Paramagnetospirillum marisnigri TaxID=1285242 RepID=A0A178MUE6_9PROT|nr:HlyD family type I secretion periplasmic adaptor subunit [Paramagnetospirillum marisnigri]OAN53687.1 hypothetical protein A6A04_13865 [Paramagnetospirillum marisnigri]